MHPGIEVGRHPCLAILAPPERHAQQIAFGTVAPLMIDAAMRHRIAAQGPANHGTSVGAPIDPGSEITIFRTGYDDRRIADEGALEIARHWDFRLEREKAPCRPT